MVNFESTASFNNSVRSPFIATHTFSQLRRQSTIQDG
jgi:hypothetical protein